jgi:hypothetical protein
LSKDLYEGQLVEAADAPRFFVQHSRVLLGHSGALVRKDDDGRVDAKGTATFIRAGAQRYILTAKHVVEGLGPEGKLLLPPYGADGADVGVARVPVELPLGTAVVHKSPIFDVAVVRAPSFDHESVGWFDVEEKLERARWVEVHWRKFKPEHAQLPYAISGYPEFGHLRNEDVKLELLAALPIFADIDSWTKGPDRELATAQNTSQIFLDGAVHPGSEELAALPLPERYMAARLKDVSVANRLGGYSGGPVAVFDTRGVHLIGTVKEGKLFFDDAKASFIASPLHESLHGVPL